MRTLSLRLRRKPFPALALGLAPALLGVAVMLAIGVDKPGNAETPRKTTPASVAGTASVVDGDTLDIHGDRIRLVGVDAPEHNQKCLDASAKFTRCGAESANALDQWINRNPVSCAIEGKDRYGRFLGKCSVRGADMQDWLVRNGHAIAYRQFSTAYVPAELAAQRMKVGIWSGEFVPPAQWRKGERLPGEKESKLASR
ncbi:MAG TPA: thermonuclease family protein [Hyphomonadaceae bacterium]|nr:thermonuclease family protein [Hyphomonadaceae bacterium]